MNFQSGDAVINSSRGVRMGSENRILMTSFLTTLFVMSHVSDGHIFVLSGVLLASQKGEEDTVKTPVGIILTKLVLFHSQVDFFCYRRKCV